jgi:hypothetical protein
MKRSEMFKLLEDAFLYHTELRFDQPSKNAEIVLTIIEKAGMQPPEYGERVYGYIRWELEDGELLTVLNKPGLTYKERISLLVHKFGLSFDEAKEIVKEKSSDY